MMKRKINIIDFFIIVAVIFSLIGIFARIYISETIEKADLREYIITMVVKGASSDNYDLISVGDFVTRKDDALMIGTVNDVDYEEHKTYMANQDKEYTVITDSSKLDITVKVAVKGEMTDDGFMLKGEHYLSAGMNITFETQNFQGKAVIMDISTEK